VSQPFGSRASRPHRAAYQSSAVARNRLRRRLREILRRDVLRTLPAVDLVIRAKRSAYTASFAVLRAELTGAVETLT